MKTRKPRLLSPAIKIWMHQCSYWLYCSHSYEGSKLVGPHFSRFPGRVQDHSSKEIIQQTIMISEEGGETRRSFKISIDIRKGRRGYLPQDEGGSRLPPHDWEHYREETPVWGRPGSHLMGAPWMMPQDEQALLAYSSDGRLPYQVDWAPTWWGGRE